jgi:hypothetical protein
MFQEEPDGADIAGYHAGLSFVRSLARNEPSKPGIIDARISGRITVMKLIAFRRVKKLTACGQRLDVRSAALPEGTAQSGESDHSKTGRGQNLDSKFAKIELAYSDARAAF